MGPLAPAPIDDHAHLLPNFAAGRHDFDGYSGGIPGHHNGARCCRRLWRLPVRHGAANREQHATGDAAPGARAEPRVTFEARVAFALPLVQRAHWPAPARGFAPPAAGEGKTPAHGGVFLEPNHLAPAGLGFESRECE